MSETESAFRIPAGAALPVALEECSNCHSPTAADQLDHGICRDCLNMTARALSLAMPPAQAPLPVADTLELEVEDELAARRALRDSVKAAAIHQPQGWLQHAVEALRTECVQGRRGHEFTVDQIIDTLERKRVQLPPVQQLQMRFVFEHGVARGWCEQTNRHRSTRRPELGNRNVRIYRSCL